MTSGNVPDGRPSTDIVRGVLKDAFGTVPLGLARRVVDALWTARKLVGSDIEDAALRDDAAHWKQRFEDLQVEHGKCLASWERQHARLTAERDALKARIDAALWLHAEAVWRRDSSLVQLLSDEAGVSRQLKERQARIDAALALCHVPATTERLDIRNVERLAAVRAALGDAASPQASPQPPSGEAQAKPGREPRVWKGGDAADPTEPGLTVRDREGDTWTQMAPGAWSCNGFTNGGTGVTWAVVLRCNPLTEVVTGD